MAQTVKNPLAMRKAWVRSLGQEDPLEKRMATHSSTLAWSIPWTEEPGRLQSTGSQRVDTTEWLSLCTCLPPSPVLPSPQSTSVSGNRQFILFVYELGFFLLFFRSHVLVGSYSISLIYFTYHSALEVNPCCHKWQDLFLFYDWIILHCLSTTFLYSFFHWCTLRVLPCPGH